MITAPKTVTVSSSGIQEAVSFGIKADGLAHIFNVLRNQLYSDKILAVMREYSANAVDANVEAGHSTTPIRVTLPNRMNLNFKVRDNGLGLSDDDIRDVYAFYGESTKRNSNALIGQLGLGSKSAFAYGDNFVINSFVGGVKSIYNAFIDDSQVGQIAKLGSEKTTEADGVEIVIPVRPEDVNTFSSKAKSLYQHFKVRPEIKGECILFNDDAPVLEGKDWKIGDSREASAVAVMGNIAYPIDYHSLNMKDDSANTNSFANSSDKIYALLTRAALVVSFNIGDLDVSASRENLQFTKRTISNVRSRLVTILDEVKEAVSKRFSNCKTIYDARVLYAELFDYSGSLHSVSSFVKEVNWNGKKIDTSVVYLEAKDNEGVLRKYEKTYRGIKIKSSLTNQIHCSARAVVVYNDLRLKNGISNRVSPFIDSKKSVVVVTVKDCAKFLVDAQMEMSNMILLSSLPVVAVVKVAGTVNKTISPKHSSKAFIFDDANTPKWTSTLSKFWREDGVDLVNDSGVYVEIERFEFKKSDSCSFESPRGIRHIIEKLTAAGIKAPVIFGFKKEALKSVRENKKFVTLHAFVKAEVEAKLKKDNLTQKFINRVEYVKAKQQWWNLRGITTNKRGVFSDACNKIKESLKAETALASIDEVCTAMSIEIKGTVTHDLGKANEEVRATYPMIFLYEYYSGNSSETITNYINLVDSNEA